MLYASMDRSTRDQWGAPSSSTMVPSALPKRPSTVATFISPTEKQVSRLSVSTVHRACLPDKSPGTDCVTVIISSPSRVRRVGGSCLGVINLILLPLLRSAPSMPGVDPPLRSRNTAPEDQATMGL